MRFLRATLLVFWRALRWLLPPSLRTWFRRLTRHPVVAWICGIPIQWTTILAAWDNPDFGGKAYYDIEGQFRDKPFAGIALFIHLGIGDYLMATALFEELRRLHPDLPIWAFIPETSDNVASAHNVHLARNNPIFNSVQTFSGRPVIEDWKKYGIDDGLKKVPKDFGAFRVIYGTDVPVWHRTTAVFEALSLPVPLPTPRPIVRPVPLTENGAALLRSVRDVLGEAPRRVALCHFDTRSSDYLYPHGDLVIRGLIAVGWVVVTLTPTEMTAPELVVTDVTRLTPNDTIELLRALKHDGHTVGIASVNSVLWPVSACLEIPNLGMHIYPDDRIHHYIYPNIRVVSQYAYPRVPPHQLVLVRSRSDFAERPCPRAHTVTDYAPEFVVAEFQAMMRDEDARHPRK